MIIYCSKCGEKFYSLIIDQDIAYREVFNKSTQHVKNKHSDLFKEMLKAAGASMAALTTYMHFDEFVIVPDTENKITEIIEKAQEIVMAALGYDPGEEEDDEEDDIDSSEEGGEPDLGVIDLPEEEDKEKSNVS